MPSKKKLMAAAVAMIVTTGMTVFGISGAAYAGCQSSGLSYRYYKSSDPYAQAMGTGYWGRDCSGTYSLNSRGDWLTTGNWSGTVTFASGYIMKFCDGQNHDLYTIQQVFRYGNVRNITMYSTRASWC